MVSTQVIGAQESCGNPQDSCKKTEFGRTDCAGPWDYRRPPVIGGRESLELVEVTGAHYTPLIRRAANTGSMCGYPEKLAPEYCKKGLAFDLDFTLRRFPNHHKALYSIAAFQLRMQREEPVLLKEILNEFRTAECYFERAARFASDDPNVFTNFGIYLQRKGDNKGALTQFQKAAELRPDDAYAQYNLGLINFVLKDYEHSRDHAHRAYELGYRKPQLREKLKRLGKW